MVLSQIPLESEGNQEESGEACIDAHEQIAHKPKDDRGVDVAPELLVTLPPVHGVHGQWDEEPEKEDDRALVIDVSLHTYSWRIYSAYPLVALPDAVQLRCHTPGNSSGAEALNVLTRPDGRALD